MTHGELVTLEAHGSALQVLRNGTIKQWTPHGLVTLIDDSHFTKSGISATVRAADGSTVESWHLTDRRSTFGVPGLVFENTLPGLSMYFEMIFASHLTLSLSVRNTGTQPTTVEEEIAFNLFVGDIKDVQIEGIAMASFKESEGGREKQIYDDLTFVGPTNSLVFTQDPIQIIDPRGRMAMSIAKFGSSTTRFWTPWEKAIIEDGSEVGWDHYLQICPGNENVGRVLLQPNELHTMSVDLYVETLG
jgi:hypothetical protein